MTIIQLSSLQLLQNLHRLPYIIIATLKVVYTNFVILFERIFKKVQVNFLEVIPGDLEDWGEEF